MEETQFKLTTPPENELPMSPTELINHQLDVLTDTVSEQQKEIDLLKESMNILLHVHNTGK